MEALGNGPVCPLLNPALTAKCQLYKTDLVVSYYERTEFRIGSVAASPGWFGYIFVHQIKACSQHTN